MKRGQSGLNAAILVAVIAVAIVIYIIFLPQDTREELLDTNSTGELYGDDNTEERVVLEDNIGRLEYISKRNNEHAIDSFNLYTRRDAEILKTVDSLSIRRGWFENKDAVINFSIDDVENTDNLLLSFSNMKATGNLIIELNGYEIFNKHIDQVNVDPVNLPKEYLAARNSVIFKSSSVGVAFWKTNEYNIEDIKISADITDLSTRESKNMFIVSEWEANNIEEATLYFVPECEPKLAGILEVMINNNQVYSAVPDCGSLVKKRLNPNHIVQGENRIVFSAEKGDFLIDRVSIDTTLKESPAYIDYFDISDEEFDDIVDENKNINLTIEFVDDIEDKEAEIIINGRKFYLKRTDDQIYSKDIKTYIESGTNSLKIIPKVTLDIREVKIEIFDD